MGRTSMKPLRFRILGKHWKMTPMRKKEYNRKKDRRGSVAITYVYKRRIYISPWGGDKETIIHELVHAYLYEMCTYSADIDDEALEEIFAELMSKRGAELLALADRLFDKLTSKGTK